MLTDQRTAHRTTQGAPRGRTCKAVTDADFDADVLKSDKPVLVDFWAEWCGPCRQVDPILEEIAAEHGDKITFVKMNVDENPVTPAAYRVTGIPTLNVYQNGELVKTIVGAKPKAALLSELERLHRLTRTVPTPAPSPEDAGVVRHGRRDARPAVLANGRPSVWVGRIRSAAPRPGPTCAHVRGGGMSDLDTAPTASPAAPLYRLGDRGQAVAEIRSRLALLDLVPHRSRRRAARRPRPRSTSRSTARSGPSSSSAA